MAALKYWIWLTTLSGLTNRSKLLLLAHFHTPEDVYYADMDEITAVLMDRRQASCVADHSFRRTEQVLESCSRTDSFVLTMDDAAYPVRLKNIFDPPLVLYGKGSLPLFDEELAVAVVGTRSATPYGLHAAEDLACQLAASGALVVSGLAKGIDAAAHRGALRAGGFTAAVLGCGVDVVYPPENRRLYEDIAATGVILSEYPPGTAADRWHFPQRNRIISGLGLAALVVEAPRHSGALITASTALEQGRDVFAVPGPIHAPNSFGCHQLIRGGAGLVSCAWDILEEYEARFPHKLRIRKTAPVQDIAEQAVPGEATPIGDIPRLDAARYQSLHENERRVLACLATDRPRLTDDVAEAAELPVHQVLSALTVLEIEGMIRSSGPRNFVRLVKLPEEE
ncbi:MAG: DNA-processing protein DprA [Oscillospiraceae bacterium]|nr:DNA-processing protein DprA [Oscillospiraceae bacterium]